MESLCYYGIGRTCIKSQPANIIMHNTNTCIHTYSCITNFTHLMCTVPELKMAIIGGCTGNKSLWLAINIIIISDS